MTTNKTPSFVPKLAISSSFYSDAVSCSLYSYYSTFVHIKDTLLNYVNLNLI